MIVFQDYKDLHLVLPPKSPHTTSATGPCPTAKVSCHMNPCPVIRRTRYKILRFCTPAVLTLWSFRKVSHITILNSHAPNKLKTRTSFLVSGHPLIFTTVATESVHFLKEGLPMCRIVVKGANWLNTHSSRGGFRRNISNRPIRTRNYHVLFDFDFIINLHVIRPFFNLEIIIR